MKLANIENIFLVFFGITAMICGSLFVFTYDTIYLIPFSNSMLFLAFVPMLFRINTLKYFLAQKYPELLDFKNMDHDKLLKEYKRLKKELK